MGDILLKNENLKVSFDTYAGEVQAVRGISFEVKSGEVLAVVGESGCGKSVTAQTIMKLNPMPPARIKEGSKITLNGKDIVNMPEKDMEEIRGVLVSMIFQDPMTSLNPTMVVGKQLTESIVKHKGINKKEAEKEAIELLKKVNIPNPEHRIHQYPHEFSGGMRQRVMIAMALSCSPKLLIADEPTTALDVTIQAQIMDLLAEIKEEMGTSIILITHDLGVVANLADRVVVMYAGKVIETGNVEDIFYRPSHPYTVGLLESLPRLDSKKDEELNAIDGTPPDLIDPPKGCEFAARCKHCMKICKEYVPPLFELGKEHKSACFMLHPEYIKRKKGGEGDE
eukprot:TRINITY_DN4606_c0_g5_i2.p1 TRINITY_DN4606_c0_g5~~TRINITY_DN4606_c0_g5_i2.p1  ORF type:complete len:339 (+),score=-20.37 TRINITY_DN4606_c0_g5_i2:1020-2036(+)